MVPIELRPPTMRAGPSCQPCTVSHVTKASQQAAASKWRSLPFSPLPPQRRSKLVASTAGDGANPEPFPSSSVSPYKAMGQQQQDQVEGCLLCARAPLRDHSHLVCWLCWLLLDKTTQPAALWYGWEPALCAGRHTTLFCIL